MQTDEPLMMKDDEHGLPQVQPGEITPDGVTWQTTTKITWTGDGWKKDVALVAQTIEHLTCNWEVVGSMPAWVSLTFSSTV